MNKLKHPGPCGKHPKMFWVDECHHCCQFLETNGMMPHDCSSHCTLCAELASAEARIEAAVDVAKSWQETGKVRSLATDWPALGAQCLAHADAILRTLGRKP
jgi:hypothetical protein